MDHFRLLMSCWRDGKGFAPYQFCIRINELMMNYLTIDYVWISAAGMFMLRKEGFSLCSEKRCSKGPMDSFSGNNLQCVKCNEANLFPCSEN